MSRPDEGGMRSGPTWGALADAVGYCVVVFAFVPPLAVFPGWLVGELGNRLNAEVPLVLGFAAVRGVNAYLSAFYVGALPGVLTGVANGTLLAARTTWLGPPPSASAGVRAGAVTGALAAGGVTLATAALSALGMVSATMSRWTVGFEIAAGMVCGALAAPRVLRLLRGPSASASQ
jgi:hypothetical protein